MNATSRTFWTRGVAAFALIGIVSAMLVLAARALAGGGCIPAGPAAGAETVVSYAATCFQTYSVGQMRKVDLVYQVANPHPETGLRLVVTLGNGPTTVNIPAGTALFTTTVDLPSMGQVSATIQSAQFACAPTCDAATTAGAVSIGEPRSASSVEAAPPDPTATPAGPTPLPRGCVLATGSYPAPGTAAKLDCRVYAPEVLN